MTHSYWPQITQALDLDATPFREVGRGALPSIHAVSDFASATIAAAGTALAALDGKSAEAVSIDRRLASLWFDFTLRPQGWEMPSVWDPIAGNYAAGDGFIRLHTNAPHHRDAALSVLGCAAVPAEVQAAVATWQAEALESAIVAAGGCAAAMRSAEAWQRHPQGRAVGAEPLVRWQDAGGCAPGKASLAGCRVLDLTRVLAGPVATRFLAGFGAQPPRPKSISASAAPGSTCTGPRIARPLSGFSLRPISCCTAIAPARSRGWAMGRRHGARSIPG